MPPKEDFGVVRLFCLVSGESPTLPFSEVKSILDAEGFSYRVLECLTQVLRFEADPICIEHIRSRSAMARVCGLEISDSKAEVGEIFRNVRNADISSIISDRESFVVRVKRVRNSSPELDGSLLERRIGEIILKKVSRARVNLKAPGKTFLGILTESRFVFGLKTAEVKPQEFIERGPRRKTFFHSAAMPANLARCMVNLAQSRPRDLVLDPFCGTGSFLIEAGLMGCRVLGFDVKRKMVGGSLRNLMLYGIEPEGMAVADARFIPLTKASVNCVVTDPPYGTSTTTLGMDAREVFESFFSAVSGFIGKGRRICLAAPKTVKVREIGERSGFKHLESHFIYIHRSLTREIAVFERE